MANSQDAWEEFVADLVKQKYDEKHRLFSALVICVARASEDGFLYAPLDDYMDAKKRDEELRGWTPAPAARLLGTTGPNGQLPVQPIPPILRDQIEMQKVARAKLEASLRQLAGDDTLSLNIYCKVVERLTGGGEGRAGALEQLLAGMGKVELGSDE